MEKKKSRDTGDNRSPLRFDNGVKQLQPQRVRQLELIQLLRGENTTYEFLSQFLSDLSIKLLGGKL